jgi:hypothetical protein
MRTVLILTLLCPAAWAQREERMDMSILYGAVSEPAVTVVATSTQPAGAASRTIGLTYQWSTAYRLYSNAAGSLYLELPFANVFSGEVAGISRGAWYFTPGVRFRIPTKTRVSFYGALGGGFALFDEKDALMNGQLTATEDPSGSHAAADFGGGIDLRLNRFMSLRVDGRDYITPAGLGGTTGRNHPVFVAGVAFHL